MKWLLLSCLSGFLLILSFPPFNFFPLAWFAFVPLFFSVQSQTRSKVVFSVIVCFLLFYLEFVRWITIFAWYGWIFAAFYLVLLTALWAWFVSPLLKNSKFSWVRLLALSFSYACLEVVFGIGTLAFPWGDLGYSQWKFLPVVQITSLVGVTGLSFLIFSCSQLLFWGIRNKKLYLLFSGCLCFIIPFVFGTARLQEKPQRRTISTALIQTNDPESLKWSQKAFQSSLVELNQLILKAGKEHPDLIILPETAVTGYLNRDPVLQGLVRKWALKTKTYLVVGTLLDKKGSPENSLVLVNPNGFWRQKYVKVRLVPFGEYVPQFFNPFKKYIPVLRGLVNFRAGKKFKVFHFPEGKFGTMICFESSFGWISRKLTDRGGEFLIVSSNDAWFEGTPAQQMHASMAIFRAVENKRSFLQVGNTGISCAINPYGKIIVWQKPETRAVVMAKIPLETGLTVYDKIGGFLPYFWIFGFLVLIGLTVIQDRKV